MVCIPEHAAMQLILRCVEEETRIQDWQIVSIQQDHFCEACCIQGKCLEGIASHIGWLVVGRVRYCCCIYACHVGEIGLQVPSILCCLCANS